MGPSMRWSRPPGRKLLLLSLWILVSACTPRTGPPPGSPVPDPAAAAVVFQAATVPVSARRASFAWALLESGSRLRGEGVVRFEAPERLRLDLFGPRGETYLAAALVGDEVRIPPQLAGQVALPSPSLLWGALGVLRPPPDARLLSATETDQQLIVRYQQHGDAVIEFRGSRAADSLRLTGVTRLGDRGPEETLELEYAPGGQLERARYRNLNEYRELTLEFKEIDEVASFPDEIWDPVGAAGS